MQSADLVREFGRPAARGARNKAVNEKLSRTKGRARRAETPEPREHTRPSYRWFITAEGMAYLGQLQQKQERADRRRQAAERRAAAVARVRDQGLGPGTPRWVRDPVVCELVALGVTGREIAAMFGITRQRVGAIAK
jgi:hypothetical protein